MKIIEFKNKLLDIIKNFLQKKLTVEEFDDCYYYFYLNNAELLTSNRDIEFFGLIQEKFEWTTENPGSAKKDGWMDYQEFYQYVKQLYEDYMVLLNRDL